MKDTTGHVCFLELLKVSSNRKAAASPHKHDDFDGEISLSLAEDLVELDP